MITTHHSILFHWLSLIGRGIRNALIVLAILLLPIFLIEHDRVCTHWSGILGRVHSGVSHCEWKWWAGILLGALLSPFVVMAIDAIKKHIRKVVPSRRLWHLKNPENAAVIISCTPRSSKRTPNADSPIITPKETAPKIDPTTNIVPAENEQDPRILRAARGINNIQQYISKIQGEVYLETRMDTGEGQVRALPYLIASLHDGYGDSINWSYLSMAALQKTGSLSLGDDRDVILIGGSQTNRYTSECFSLLARVTGVEIQRFNGGGITIKLPKKEDEQEAEVFDHPVGRVFVKPAKESLLPGQAFVTEEYSIIIRWRRAQENLHQNRFYVFAGCTTHGTAIAAQFFCEESARHPEIKALKDQDYLAVVKTILSPHTCVQLKESEVVKVIPLTSIDTHLSILK